MRFFQLLCSYFEARKIRQKIIELDSRIQGHINSYCPGRSKFTVRRNTQHGEQIRLLSQERQVLEQRITQLGYTAPVTSVV